MSLHQLVFDPTAADADRHNVGAYVRAASGALITSTTDGAKQRLDVTLGAEYLEGSAFTAGDKGVFMLAVDENGDYRSLKVNNDGELLVDVTVTTGADKAEDSAHVSGDIGSYVLAVRQDILASSVGTDGDYASFKVDSVGALWTNVAKIAPATGHVAGVANTVTVNSTAGAVPATALTGRKKIIVQNVGTVASAYLGFTAGVTTSTGAKLAPGASVTLELDETLVLYAITTALPTDLRYIELA